MVTSVNGNTYNDGSTPPGNMGNGGHRENLLKMISDLLADAGKALITTSVSSLTIGTGAKVFVLAEDRPFSVGAFVIATHRANVANQMFGKVTAKAGASITVDVAATGGAGTIADWEIQISGPIGPPGSPPDATEGTKGIAEIAMQAEVDAGTDDARMLTPLKLKNTTLVAGRLIDEQVFTANGTWNKPAGMSFAIVELVGGGGGGSGAASTSSGQASIGGGGGGGCYARKRIAAGSLGATESVTVGAAGAAGGAGTAGGDGGPSSFGSHVTGVAGGKGGSAPPAGAPPRGTQGGVGGGSSFGGGPPTGADLFVIGANGTDGYLADTALNGPLSTGGMSGMGFGTGGRGQTNVGGEAGRLYGGGGGGTARGPSAGAGVGVAGAAGIVIVRSYT